jgi:hypothetical protein
MLIDSSCKLQRTRSQLKLDYFDIPPEEAASLAGESARALEAAGALGDAVRRLSGLHDGRLLSFAESSDGILLAIEDPETEGESGRVTKVRISGIRRRLWFGVGNGGRLRRLKYEPRCRRFLRACLIEAGDGFFDLALVFSVPGPSRLRYFPFLELEAASLELTEAQDPSRDGA